ncbi:MAG: DUF4261 domain-containing protein [Sphingomonas sp.]|jgi:hypothetical protein|uniref:DUF4261 domain-containing protein n=1 Tax=Sphingomonas sp. TaxID=28214 RepID=UPI0035699589
MAVITFSRPVSFPTAPLRDLLQKHFPTFKWQCGEHDMGGAKEMGRFLDHMLIVGRSPETAIFTELRSVEAKLPGPAPQHVWHLQVGNPTTDISTIADRVTLIICMTVMILDEHEAMCQLRPGGNWLGPHDLLRVFKVILAGESISVADGLGVPEGHFSGAAAPAAALQAPTIGRDPPRDVNQRMLAPMVLMLERNLQPDWPTIERFARELDPDGDWRHRTMPGADVLVGRGVRVMVDTKDEPVPPFVYEDSYNRSFWFKGDKAAIAAHRRHATVGCALDTSAADWVTIRQTAKVITLVTGMLARLPGTVAVYNMDIGTIYEPAMVGDFLKMLGRDQLPVALWSWSQWHSMADGDVSMSTSGLTPFLGHEIETWNAPLTCEEVRSQASDIIIYLLDAGPTIGHGDTAGRTRGDQSIRCFFGPSRARRDKPVRAMFLEFGDRGAVQPQADPPRSTAPVDAGRMAAQMIDGALQSVIASTGSEAMRRLLSDVAAERAGQPAPPAPLPAAAPPVASPLRRVGGFGRKGL